MTESRLAPEEVRTRTFTRVVRGYRRKEVRRLLERAAADLARLRNGVPASGPDDQPPLTAQEVEEARFQPALGGYEMDEVDEFLDQLVVELERAARDPLRPPSALPAPTREAPFAGVGPGVGAGVGPGPTPGPGPIPGPHPARAPGPGPGSRPPGSPPGPVEPMAPAAEPRPAEPRGPAAGPLPPAAGPLPAAPPPPAAVSRAPGVAPPAREPVPDEGFFPPESVPPSAAPAPPPPAPRPPGPTPARPLTPSEVEARTFERGAPGYLPNHVDLFLAKAARALTGRDGETLSRWDVLRQRFPLGPRGYAANEVDAFLVRLAAQFPDPDPAAQQEILRKLEGR
jgi:DivIVA domain-containing protein